MIERLQAAQDQRIAAEGGEPLLSPRRELADPFLSPRREGGEGDRHLSPRPHGQWLLVVELVTVVAVIIVAAVVVLVTQQ